MKLQRFWEICMKSFGVLALAFAFSQSAFAIPVNLLVNPGFETGDFTGWTISGNNIQVGVATTGTSIPNADSPFRPNFQNVRSGNFAGNALVKTFPLERIILTQTIAVLPSQNVDVGFWLGNDSPLAIWVPIDDTHTQIFIDGIGLLSNGHATVAAGSTP